MNLFNPYKFSHKGLRYILSKFLVLLGKTDYSNKIELGELQKIGKELFILLESHVKLEETILLHELGLKIGKDVINDFNQHHELDTIEQKIKANFKNLNENSTIEQTHLFYLDFSLFYSLYLQHLHEEETKTLKQLQQTFTEEELIQIHLKVLENIESSHQLIWNKYILPSVTTNEKKLI